MANPYYIWFPILDKQALNAKFYLGLISFVFLMAGVLSDTLFLIPASFFVLSVMTNYGRYYSVEREILYLDAFKLFGHIIYKGSPFTLSWGHIVLSKKEYMRSGGQSMTIDTKAKIRYYSLHLFAGEQLVLHNLSVSGQLKVVREAGSQLGFSCKKELKDTVKRKAVYPKA
jgi:hypothetical protein